MTDHMNEEDLQFEQEISSTKKEKKKRKRKHPILHAIGMLILLILSVCCIGFCCAYGAITGAIASAPSIESIDISPSGFVTTIYNSDGQEVTQLVSSGANRIYVTLDEIPEDVQNAFVAIEDKRFYEHNGIDLNGIARAAYLGVKNGFHFSQGASTLTQQLLKNNVFDGWTSESGLGQRVRRKLQEQYLALQLEQITDKDTILENYLNTINLGSNTLGVQSASQRYFNKDVSELTLSEAAVIAGITQNPSRYNPITNPEENATRRDTVLSEMLTQGYITQTEYDEAINDDVYSRIQTVNNESDTSIYSYFVDALIQQVIDDLMEEKGYSQVQAQKLVYSGGLSIYTTQDAAIQQICDEEFANAENYPADTKYSFSLNLAIEHADGTVSYYDENSMLSYVKENVASTQYLIYNSQEEAYEAIQGYEQALMTEGDSIPENGELITYTPQPQASMVVMDQRTGEVKAIVGGRGQKQASLTLNRATNTYRQPGSCFKILSTYAPALDSGAYTLASVQDDAPMFYNNGVQVHNYDNVYRGFTTIREGIWRSMNIVAVKTLTDITPKVGYDTLLDFGITSLTEDDQVQAMALGGITRGVSNIEITAAYAAIANAGTYTEPILYTKIVDHEGNTIINNEPETRQVIKDTTAFLLTDAMKDVVTIGTGTRANFGTTAIAGKTGTTNTDVDSWFVGYTNYYTCGIWGGYDTNMPQDNTSYTLTLWNAVMSRIHADLPWSDFAQPSGIVTATVCAKSGLLPLDICSYDPRGSMLRTEYFAAGTVPTATCNHHSSVTICAESGLIATDYCLESSTAVIIIGGEAGTQDSSYSIAGYCNLHNEETYMQYMLELEAEEAENAEGIPEGDTSTVDPAATGAEDAWPVDPEVY